MALKKSSKKKLITKFRTHDKDTGSPQVQIGILTKEIDEVTKHLKEHKKDNSARRGLLAKVARRRKLLTYLKMNDEKGYGKMLKNLDIEK
jgi:small subunit ribosomal protein S15